MQMQMNWDWPAGVVFLTETAGRHWTLTVDHCARGQRFSLTAISSRLAM